jgi:hypothetical protein
MPWPEAAGEAQIDRSDPAVFTIRLSGTGTVAIGTSYANVPWRRVTVRAGDRVVIEAPAASATLAISAKRMATAGIVLRSDEVDGWNPMIGILDYHASVATVAELPPGRFHLFRTFAAGHWSKARSFSGAPLVLESGKTTSIPAYEDEKREPIEVVLQESDGTPVQNATLFVEDPMEYPVREDTNLCSMGDLVGPPLAPRLRVVNGLVTLPAMSAGQLLLRIVRDEGSVFTCARDVVPGKTLTIALPPPR